MDMSTSLVSKFLLFLFRVKFSSNRQLQVKPTQLTVFVEDSVFVFLDLEVHLDLFDLLRCLREGGHHWLDAEHVLDVLGVAPGSRCQNVPCCTYFSR